MLQLLYKGVTIEPPPPWCKKLAVTVTCEIEGGHLEGFEIYDLEYKRGEKMVRV